MARTPTLSLVLTPEAVGSIHDVLVCLAKFSETVSIEARKDKVDEPGLSLLRC